MATPYFGFTFKRYGETIIADMYINPNLGLRFIRARAPIMQGHWRYLGTTLEGEHMETYINIPLKPDGYWDSLLEMALHDANAEGKVK